MDIMLKRIIELIGTRHGAAQELVKAIGATTNAVTEWKSGRSKSYTKYAPQIAEFYGVSLDWLSGNSEQKEKPAAPKDDELSEDEANMLFMYRQLSEDWINNVTAHFIVLVDFLTNV